MAIRSKAFVLLHSPLVGPRTWRDVADVLAARGALVVVPSFLGVEDAAAPAWRWVADTAARAVHDVDGDAVLVAHSGAGPLAPVIADAIERPCVACLFVDASLPAIEGATPLLPDAFRSQLSALAENGILPAWSAWWGPGVMDQLIPDPKVRSEVERELPRVPLAYFDHAAPVPRGWSEVPCAYLQFSDAYASEADEARARGWLVDRIPGEHLQMLVEPSLVADRLARMATRVARTSG
jgi:hypothetical protein